VSSISNQATVRFERFQTKDLLRWADPNRPGVPQQGEIREHKVIDLPARACHCSSKPHPLWEDYGHPQMLEITIDGKLILATVDEVGERAARRWSGLWFQKGS
jgi:hypothetical protein